MSFKGETGEGMAVTAEDVEEGRDNENMVAVAAAKEEDAEEENEDDEEEEETAGGRVGAGSSGGNAVGRGGQAVGSGCQGGLELPFWFGFVQRVDVAGGKADGCEKGETNEEIGAEGI